MERECYKCRKIETDEEPLHAHHIIPVKGWKGHDRDGRILLCDGCHALIGNMMLAQVGKWLAEDNITGWKKCRDKMSGFTDWWLKR